MLNGSLSRSFKEIESEKIQIVYVLDCCLIAYIFFAFIIVNLIFFLRSVIFDMLIKLPSSGNEIY